MNIGICDDDKVWHKRATSIIQEYAQAAGLEMEVVHFYTGQEVKEYQGVPIDVMLIDVELEGENGIDVAQRINCEWERCAVVYLTNYLSYATDVYHTEHVFYVLKEQFAERIGEVFEKIRKVQDAGHKQLIFSVIGEVKNVILAPYEMLYFERTGRVTRLETVWGRYMLHEKLDEIMQRLPQGDFVRCHNSYIIHFAAVRTFAKGMFHMKNGADIMISRSYQKSVKEAFARWSLGQLV